MKNSVLILFLLLISKLSFCETILPVYDNTKVVNRSKIDTSYPFSTTYEYSEIEIINNSSTLKLRINGQQLETYHFVDLPDIIIDYNGQNFLLPYYHYISTPMLMSAEISSFLSYKNIWLLRVRTIDDGARGPKYPRNTWFLLQLITDKFVLSDPLWTFDEEESFKDIPIEEYIAHDQNYLNIGNLQYIYKDSVLVRDYRFIDNIRFVNIAIDNVNIREQPNTQSKVVQLLKAGERIKAIKYAGKVELIDGKEGSWILVNYITKDNVGIEGYVFGPYIK